MIRMACPRCKTGNMFYQRQIEGPDAFECLQCGHSIDVRPSAPAPLYRDPPKRKLMREVPAL